MPEYCKLENKNGRDQVYHEKAVCNYYSILMERNACLQEKSIPIHAYMKFWKVDRKIVGE